MNADTTRKILDAVDAGFDAQLKTTRDFVAIPSTRGAEGPCQDMIGDLLRERGDEGADGGRNLSPRDQCRKIADPAGTLRRGADRPTRDVGNAAVLGHDQGRPDV